MTLNDLGVRDKTAVVRASFVPERVNRVKVGSFHGRP
jgi:hypothetical protein